MALRPLSRLPTAVAILVLLALPGASVLAASGAPGALDTSFDPGTGANDAVFAVALQPDGMVLVGGQFTQFAGSARGGLVRVGRNGALDAAYSPSISGTGFAGVTSIALQPDGKAIVGGLFSQVNGAGRVNIARLNGNGALDPGFAPGAGVTGPDAYLNVVSLQPVDGKVLIGGVFTGYNGVPRNNIARLTTAGALDTTFDPGSGADDEVAAIAVQPADGKVLVGGSFGTVNGAKREGIARLHANGSLDGAFAPTVDGAVLAIAVQADGKILIGGFFTTVNGATRHRIARLNPNGTLDPTFGDAAIASQNVHVAALAAQPNGRIVIGGQFTTVGGVERRYIARLKADGTLDASFDPGSGANWTVFAVTLQGDGRVLIGGAFTSVDDVSRGAVARLLGDQRAYLPLVVRQ